jgi:hypothetical protein
VTADIERFCQVSPRLKNICLAHSTVSDN